MKKHLNIFLTLAASGVLCVTACKKDETKVIYDGGTPPVLTATVSDSIHLSVADSAQTAVTFAWSNPNYAFSDGISSQNVVYNLQIDTTPNFNGPNMQSPSVSSDLGMTYTVDAFNSLVANSLELATGMQHTIYVRVQSSLAPYTSGSPLPAALTSNTMSFTVTPFAPPPAVAPPSSGELFMVGGDPLLGSWANPVPASQQFTQVSPLEYKLTIALSGGDPGNTNASDQFLLIPVNGSWGAKYASTLSPSSTLSGGGTFQLNASNNFAGPTTAGTYTIDVNFQTGKYTVTKN